MITTTLGLTASVGTVAAETAKGGFTSLFDVICNRFDLYGSETSSIAFAACIFLCLITAYLIGSVNPAIIFSRVFFHEDIRSFGSGNAGTTNTLRTYGKRMAVLIFILDLVKSAVAILLGSLILTRQIGGAVAALFVVLGHMFPIYYKFKGGKGVACTAICILILSPAAFVILLPLFVVIVALTRYISLGSIISAMMFPFLSHVFYRQHGWITLSAFCIAALVVFMHRENIKRLMSGKESKLSFKKTDKHAVNAHDGASAEKNESTSYGEGDFVTCACGRLIPRSRKECVYCGEKNPKYVPKTADGGEEGKGKRKK